MRKVFGILFVYLVLVFAGAILVSFFVLAPRSDLLEEYQQAFLFRRGLLLFFEVLPAVVCSGFFIGCAVVFGRSVPFISVSYSSVMLKWCRKAFVLALFCVFSILVSQEAIVPLVHQVQRAAVRNSDFYREYLSLAKTQREEGNAALAMLYAELALAIQNNSAEAQAVYAAAELDLAESAGRQVEAEPPPVAAGGLPVALPEGETVLSLLEKSRAAASQEDWFNAHYYAILAQALSVPDSQNAEAARREAAEAWNQLGRPVSEEDQSAAVLYAEKFRGYTALINGDYLESYYIFTDLIERVPTDPDVQRFYALAKSYTDSQYFFIDEARSFSSMSNLIRNVSFSIPERADGRGVRYVVHIGAMSSLKASGDMAQYLQNVSVSSFDRSGAPLSSFSVPYAKMLAFPVSRLTGDLAARLNTSDPAAAVPYLLLESIDRARGTVVSSPVYDFGEPAEAENYMVLPVPYADFILAARASFGPKVMSLGDLISFAPRASYFGYSTEVYAEFLFQRILTPFWLLTMLIICAIAGWKYQIGRMQAFHTWYLLAFPFLTCVIFLLIRMGSYAAKLVCLSAIAFWGIYWAFVVVAAFSLLVLIGVCSVFASCRSDR